MPLRVMSEFDGSQRVDVGMLLKVLSWLRISMATSAKCKYNVSEAKRVAVHFQGLVNSDWVMVVVQGSGTWVPVTACVEVKKG